MYLLMIYYMATVMFLEIKVNKLLNDGLNKRKTKIKITACYNVERQH